ncbi:MAG: response regulator transcription factor [Flavobacteriaceae bacterium]|nr:response regulator transcription factor [Flavobacteriaceae bacterium]
MIKIIIVDDSLTSRIILEKILIVNFENRYCIAEICESVDSAKIAIKKHKPELVFLDIEMPDKNGFDLLKEIDLIDFEVIFTTSYQKYAIKALQSNAIDYLIKPINTIDLISAIERFEIKYSKKLLEKNIINDKVDLEYNNDFLTKVAFPTVHGYEFLKINSILYCEAKSNYCKIICIDGRELLLAKTLKNIELLLPTNLFHRIHKSYLVNLNYISRFKKSKIFEIELYNGTKLPVSFRKKNNFLNVFRNKV